MTKLTGHLKLSTMLGAAVVAVLVCAPISVSSQEISGINFEPLYLDEGDELILQGVGLKTFLMMKAFVAGFYLEEGISKEAALEDVSKRLDVAYFKDIRGKDLTNYTVRKMRKNISEKEFSKVEDRLGKMEDYFVDLQAGDKYSLAYHPGVGTKFIHNGKLMGTIEGADFAKGLFSVWIGDKPMDIELKQEILGRGQDFKVVKKKTSL